VAAPKGVRVIDAKGLHIYPGMIDAGTSLGMEEIGSVRETNDRQELGEFKPQLRAAIAVNPASEHIPVARANGITAYLAMPEGGSIAGQASLMRLDGWTWEEMEINRSAAMHVAFPTISTRGLTFPEAFRRTPYAEAKRSYERKLKDLSEFLESARRYQVAKAAGGAGFRMDLKLEAMLPVIEKKTPMLITAVRERAVRDAIAFSDKERVRVILSGVREPGKSLADLKKRDIPVILGPTLELPLEEDDSYDSPFTLPNELHKAGVKFAFASFSSQFSRNLPYQAANAVGFGLPYEEGLKAVTLYPAQIFGVADRIGSLEKGKWADLMVTDGDPLEGRTNVKMVFIQGKTVDIESKHTRLYRRYLGRP
jgi:imidazolonepropionase-like amidohydrolase